MCFLHLQILKLWPELIYPCHSTVTVFKNNEELLRADNLTREGECQKLAKNLSKTKMQTQTSCVAWLHCGTSCVALCWCIRNSGRWSGRVQCVPKPAASLPLKPLHLHHQHHSLSCHHHYLHHHHPRHQHHRHELAVFKQRVRVYALHAFSGQALWKDSNTPWSLDCFGVCDTCLSISQFPKNPKNTHRPIQDQDDVDHPIA